MQTHTKPQAIVPEKKPASVLELRIARLSRLYAVHPAMAETLAPLVYPEAR